MSYEKFKAEQTGRLEAIYSALDADELNKDDVKTQISSVLEEQAKYGKTQYDKKASQIKKFEDVLGEIGYDSDKEESVKQFAESFKNRNENISDTERSNRELIERLTRLEAEDADRKEQATKLKSENDRNTITTKLTEALGDKLKGSKYVIKDLINEGRVKLIDGEVMFADGEDVVLFDKGVEGVLSSNEDLIVNVQHGGGNTTKTTTKTTTDIGLSRDSINNMSPEDLKANIAEIKKMAGVR